MLEPLAHFNFASHRVYVSRDSDTQRIHCFKYTPSRCDLDSFDSQEMAADYILEPMPTLGYELLVHDEHGNPLD